MKKTPLSVVILAAGKGTRMKSDKAKVLHALAGKPLLGHVLSSASKLKPERQVVVVGHQADEVKRQFGEMSVEFVEQKEQKGTGHAVSMAESVLENFEGWVLILCGDMPLIRIETLKELIRKHEETHAACTLLSLKTPVVKDFGRVMRDESGNVIGIVENKDASSEQKKIDEYNSGVYCFIKGHLFNALKKIDDDNAQNELYLTDVIEILVKDGHRVDAVPTRDEAEIIGINSREDLEQAEQIFQKTLSN